jgi:protein arginine kinase
MVLDDLLHQNGAWLKAEGPHASIVISSRIRLARNIGNLPFPHWASKEQKNQIVDLCAGLSGDLQKIEENMLVKIPELSDADRLLLVERHLMSREHMKPDAGRAAIIFKSEVCAIMVNEEDHLRLQVMMSGFDLDKAYTLVNKLDAGAEKFFTFAFDHELGYLTACLTNVGTGLRASCMLHLPCLVWSKQMQKILQAILKLGLTARGFYGEGTEATGDFFQISNQVTLGFSETEIIDNLKKIIAQVIEQEMRARESFIAHNRLEVEDRIWRAYGTLKNAHIINSQETIDLLSSVRLGIDLGIIKNVTVQDLNYLFIFTQPAHLQKLRNKQLTPEERDLERARLIREKI